MVPDACRVEIRVVPRAAQNGIDGMRDGRIVVRVTAPPVDGAATKAAVSVLAEALGVARTTIQVVSGQSSRNKAVTIGGLGAAAVFSRLAIGPDRTAGSTERPPRDRRSSGSDRRRSR